MEKGAWLNEMVPESTRGSLTIVSLLQILPASKEMHKASSNFIKHQKSVILAICGKLAGFTKCWESLKRGEVVLYVLPLLVSINCLTVYPENADLCE